MKYLFFILIIIIFGGCSVGHQGFVDFKNDMIDKNHFFTKPFKFKDAGKLRRADFLITGQGLTHITKDADGNILYHWDSEEVLSNYGNSDIVGKCLFYYIADPKTNIIIGWGFNEGGNPQSCRTWP